MPLPYSADLRERVLLAYEHGEGTTAVLARRFRLALNTVKNWVRAAESEGRRVAKPLGHGPEPRLSAAAREVLCQLVAADNHATLAEYGARLAGQTGVRVSRSVLCITLKRLGLARKKRRSGRAGKDAPMSSPNALPLSQRSTTGCGFSAALAIAPPKEKFVCGDGDGSADKGSDRAVPTRSWSWFGRAGSRRRAPETKLHNNRGISPSSSAGD
jgi:transposase